MHLQSGVLHSDVLIIYSNTKSITRILRGFLIVRWWNTKQDFMLLFLILTFRIGHVLPAAGAGWHQRAAGLMIWRLVGFGGHHELLAGQTRCGRGSTVLQGFKLNCWEDQIQMRERQERWSWSFFKRAYHFSIFFSWHLKCVQFIFYISERHFCTPSGKKWNCTSDLKFSEDKCFCLQVTATMLGCCRWILDRCHGVLSGC